MYALLEGWMDGWTDEFVSACRSVCRYACMLYDASCVSAYLAIRCCSFLLLQCFALDRFMLLLKYACVSSPLSLFVMIRHA